MVTTDSGETYRVNGHCSCRAAQLGQPCKHLALLRLLELYAEEPDPPKSPALRAIRSVERDVVTRHRIQTVRTMDGWYI